MVIETRTQNEIWSPNNQTIVGRRDVANAARQSLWAIVTDRLNNIPAEHHSQVIRLTDELENLIRNFEAEGVAERIVALEAELAQVCEYGERAEQEFVNAKNQELIVRNADNKRLERYNAATKALDKLKSEPLPTFHTNKHVSRKIERICDAQAEIDAALADMNAHPLAIPTVVQAKLDAEQRVNQLAARARAIRKELAQLRGEPVDATGNAGHSSIGLA